MRTEQNPSADFAAFRDWLVATRGVGRRTAYTAVSQVRRVLRECGPQTSEASLGVWYRALEPHHRSPIASNWSRWIEWWATEGVVGLPDFPRRPGSAQQGAKLPTSVLRALCHLQASGIPPSAIHRIRWRPLPVDGPLYAALCTSMPSLLDGSLTALQTESGVVTLPTDAVTALCAWGHGGAPAPEAPLVPEAPGAGAPMTITRLRRMARKGRTA